MPADKIFNSSERLLPCPQELTRGCLVKRNPGSDRMVKANLVFSRLLVLILLLISFQMPHILKLLCHLPLSGDGQAVFGSLHLSTASVFFFFVLFFKTEDFGLISTQNLVAGIMSVWWRWTVDICGHSSVSLVSEALIIQMEKKPELKAVNG